MARLSGKRALVTGGTRGIGLAVVRRLVADGAIVAANGTGTRPLAQDADGREPALVLPADVGSPDDVRTLFERTEAELGALDIVVAVAGTMRPAALAEATLDDYEFNFGVNARGTFLTLSEAARRVAVGGRIIAFSTNLTRLPRQRMGLYQASKAAVEQMAFSLARELGPRQITVNVVAPGGTDTEMLSQARRTEIAAETPLGRIASPADIADVVAFLASDEARWVNGQVVGVNGGII